MKLQSHNSIHKVNICDIECSAIQIQRKKWGRSDLREHAVEVQSFVTTVIYSPHHPTRSSYVNTHKVPSYSSSSYLLFYCGVEELKDAYLVTCKPCGFPLSGSISFDPYKHPQFIDSLTDKLECKVIL